MPTWPAWAAAWSSKTPRALNTWPAANAPRPHLQPGNVDRLDGGGLYRRSAIEAAGYFSDRNLHSYEEFDLAIRLRALGWRLWRLPLDAANHFGHDAPPYRLLVRRWRTRYICGLGELVRAAAGQPRLPLALQGLRELRIYLAVLGWWAVLASCCCGRVGAPGAWHSFCAIATAPVLLMTWRKRSVTKALYSVVSWCFNAAGLLRGLLRRQRPAREAIASRVLKEPAGAFANRRGRPWPLKGATQQFTGVQILRFAAAMLVVVMHITQAISIHISGTGPSHYWARLRGVDIFFVISGFVMAMSTPRCTASDAASRINARLGLHAKAPAEDRTALLVLYLVEGRPAAGFAGSRVTRSSVEPGSPGCLPFLHSGRKSVGPRALPTLPVGWTLNFEMLFYAVFAAAIALGAPRIRFCLAVFLLIFTGRLLCAGLGCAEFLCPDHRV
jgi:hypothetical protein